jgi:hypothetical protein
VLQGLVPQPADDWPRQARAHRIAREPFPERLPGAAAVQDGNTRQQCQSENGAAGRRLDAQSPLQAFERLRRFVRVDSPRRFAAVAP